jgi:hypothetical protein
MKDFALTSAFPAKCFVSLSGRPWGDTSYILVTGKEDQFYGHFTLR